MGKLAEILDLKIETGNCAEAYNYVMKALTKYSVSATTDEDQNIYVTKGKEPNYPCFLTTLYGDSIKYNAEIRRIVKNTWVGFRRNAGGIEPTSFGIGSKVGMYTALKLIEKLPDVKIVFLSKSFGNSPQLDFFDNCRYVIQLEGKGNSELIVRTYGSDLCSTEFKEAVRDISKKTNYCVSTGPKTDITALKDKGLKLSAAVLALGYHCPYMGFHHVREADIGKAVEFAEKLAREIKAIYSDSAAFTKCVKCNRSLSPVEDYYCFSCLSSYRAAHSKCNNCNSNLFSGEEFYHVRCRMCLNK